MSDSVVIYGMAISNYVRSVLICCEEKGIDYKLKAVKLRSPELLAMNPLCKVPVLKLGDFTLFETAAICRFIDRNFEGPSLSPQDLQPLAHMDQWISAVNGSFDPVFIRRFILEYAFPKGADGKPDQARIEAALPDVKRHLKIVNDALSQSSYLTGETPTIADYFMIPILDYLAKIPPKNKLMNDMSATSDYLERMRQRPSCAKVLV